MPSPLTFPCLALSMLLAPCLAQEAKPEPATPAAKPPAAAVVTTRPAADTPHHLVRRYPQDKDVPIAIVGPRTLTLGDLVDHIDARHYPRFKKELVELPTVQAMLQSDLIAPWVRHFADLEALRQTFAADLDEKKLQQAQSDALKASFESWLATYVNDPATGRTRQLTQDQVTRRLTTFQWHNGLAAELQGTLDHLEPGEYNRVQLQNFYNANARAFGGQVTIAHILIQHRDAGTGILLNDEGLGLANARLADIKARLRPDGSNFEEVAVRSDDQKTARDGGRLQGVHRYDDRLPGALCRAAWELRDGEVSDVIETQYGWHIVKRLEYNQNVLILFTDDAIPTIKMVMRRAMQEERLMAARKQAGVRLLL